MVAAPLMFILVLALPVTASGVYLYKEYHHDTAKPVAAHNFNQPVKKEKDE